MPEVLTDRQIKTWKRLIKIERDLRRRLTNVLEDVLIKGLTIEQFSQSKVQSVLKLMEASWVALNELLRSIAFQMVKRTGREIDPPDS